MNLSSILNSIGGAVPTFLLAILQLALALAVAFLVKVVVQKLGRRLGLDAKLEKLQLGGKSQSSLGFVASALAFFVFLIFLPGILVQLGLGAVSVPIGGMIGSFLGYVPNILGALIILLVGIFFARIVKRILIVVLQKTKLDGLQEKLGVSAAGENAKLSAVLGNIAYILILIPIIIAALDALKIASISAPAVSILNSIFGIIPNIFVAVILMVLGVFVAKLVASLLNSILSGVGADKFAQKLAGADVNRAIPLSKIVCEAVRVVIILLFAVQAIGVLRLSILSDIGASLVNFIPPLVYALLIMAGAYLLGAWLQVLMGKASASKVPGVAVKAAVLAVAAFVALNQLGFAMSILNTAFLIVLCALGVAFAISFGIGGREFAAKALRRADKKMDDIKAGDTAPAEEPAETGEEK